jgi:hypothetical protein
MLDRHPIEGIPWSASSSLIRAARPWQKRNRQSALLNVNTAEDFAGSISLVADQQTFGRLTKLHQ